ncbi:helix-turn-helix domain-containing protein [Halapricum salinum]|uniref:HTH bat-type domain-containing protein n=1 Tax=Halapricum salinum TaxID=1457250 RepID=A0A4D6HB40_9EURY|nr:helix-turn-helix domain-containing protein [Halapricum salinum]QCC50446.1 hypothetical protein DV733_03980 [Halapricum salinum]
MPNTLSLFIQPSRSGFLRHGAIAHAGSVRLLDVEVLDVGSYDRAVTTPLTDRQREAVEAAREVGYYEVPRTGDIETVARELDCAVSTASTLLRRAESRLVERTLEAFW